MLDDVGDLRHCDDHISLYARGKENASQNGGLPLYSSQANILCTPYLPSLSPASLGFRTEYLL